MEVVVGMRYLVADFITGDLFPLELPLRDVVVGSSVDIGEMRCTLDMREVVDTTGDWVDEARYVQEMLRAGTSSIIVQDEGTGRVDEWWIVDVVRSHADPVISITGLEFPAYLRQDVLQTARAGTFDPVSLTRVLLAESLSRTGQEFSFSFGAGGSSLTGSVEWRAGSISYWDALEELRGDDLFEWRIDTTLVTQGGVPAGVKRMLNIGVPQITQDHPEVVLEAVTPGDGAAGLHDFREDDPVTARASEVWGFGSGYGQDQPTYKYDRPRVARMPRLGVTFQARDADTQARLNRAGWKALGRMHPDKASFDVVADLDVLPAGGPTVGDVYWMIRRPSLSVPLAETFRVRVLAWERTPDRPGSVHTATLTMRRENF